ncbi:ecdysone-inducible gene L2 [Lycorma delicatula]|uniref:ecdysone-inducible gene L2 n=1 Tax=Lycorma delicatula TaxID=130591 RepID=UPI003F51214D
MSVVIFAVLSTLPILVFARVPNFRHVFFDSQNAIPASDKSDEVQKDFPFREWVKVSQNAPRVVHVATGDRVEFECETFGSPSPTVQWSRGPRPQPPVYEENNNVAGMGLGKTISRLVIDCVLPYHQDIYTCLASTGTETAASHTTTLLVHVHGNNLTNVLTKCQENKPRIINWSPIIMETIGNDVTLPCSAKGISSPQLYWIDKDEKLINNEPDSRYKVLESGDLVITKLRWSDMGGYSCVAQSSAGRDSETTFLYPMDDE